MRAATDSAHRAASNGQTLRVFPAVVMVQQRRHRVDVIADEFRPIAIAERHGGDESGISANSRHKRS